MTIDITVEVAFNAGYRTPAVDRVWTDITQYVEGQSALSISYGRGDELSNADANRLTGLVLDNRDGRFTLGNTASPYYPNVKIGRPIRVTATVAGQTSTRFVGYVDQWPVEWPGGDDSYATAPITASSRLSRLGLNTPLARPLETTVVTDLAAGQYWPLSEAKGATEGREMLTGTPPLAFASAPREPEFGKDQVVLSDSTGVTLEYDIAGSAYGWDIATYEASPVDNLSFLNPGDAFTVALVFRSLEPESSKPAAVSFEFFNPRRLFDFEITVDPATQPEPHSFVVTVTRTSSTTWSASAYLDGALAYSDSGGLVASDASPTRLCVNGPSSTTQSAVVVGSVATWDHGLSGAQIQQHADAVQGFVGDTTDARAQRYAAWAHIDSAEIVTTPSAVQMSAVPAEGGQVVSLLRTVETTENGILHDDRDGRLVLEPRQARYNAAPDLVVDMTAQLVGVDYAPRADRQGLVNIGQTKNADGTIEITYTNESSRQEYGDATYSAETHALDPEEPLQLAAYAVNARSEPAQRAPSLSLKVLDWSGANLTALLGLDIGSLIQLAGRPAAAGASTVEYFVEGYTERLDPFQWTISPNLSSSFPDANVFVLDDAVNGVLDGGMVLGL